MLKKIALFLLVIVSGCQIGYSQWYKNQFVIGSFADPRVFGVNREFNPLKDSISFSLAEHAYINLLSGPQFYNGAQDFSLMDKTLDMASKHHMHVMVIDSKLQVTGDNFSNTDAQRVLSHFKSLDPKRRAAVGGYSFGGEFPKAKSETIKKWAGFFNNNDEDRPGYTYLLPVYGFKSKGAYEEYLDKYLDQRDSNNMLNIVAYDYYPFLSSFLSSYFYNIGIIKEKAGNRPVWYYVQTTTKRSLPDINDYQLRFMAYCPIAYGSKGVIYYTYESLPEKMGLNYYDAIIAPNGQPTKKYYSVRSINYYITNIAGPIVMKNSCVGTYHVSNSPTNEDIPDKYILQKNNEYITSISNRNILVGVFKSESDRYFLMIVNKASTDVSNVSVTVPGNKSAVEFPESTNYHGQKNKTGLDTRVNNNKTSFVINKLPAGEMTVVQIDQK